MIRGLYTAVSGLVTQEAKQQVITNNLANANTVGFKKDDLAIKAFDEVLIENYDKLVGGKNVRNVIGSLSYGSAIDETKTFFTQGMLQQTEKTTDFAVDGRGFFSVARTDLNGNSETFYTRDGHFHVDIRGYLVNDSGDKVLGRNNNSGAVEPIYIGKAQMLLDGDNNLLLDGNATYKFSTVDFPDYNENYPSLKKAGDNLYSGENPVDNPNIAVKQNTLEKSNVNIINEMVNMMTVMRSFESNQKIIQSMDETLGKAVNEVGVVR
jgi:flagellar basal-body rod protein FlgF